MIEEKIAKVLMEFLASNTDGGGRGGEFKVKDLVEELTTLIKQEKEKAYLNGVNDFCDWNIRHSDGGYAMDMMEFLKEQNK